LPIWIVVVNSWKPQGEALSLGVWLPHHWQIGRNYSDVYHQGKVLQGLRNSIIVAIPALVGILLVSSFASWIFARGRSRVLHGLYYLSIVAILVPPAVVASVLVVRWLHLYGSFFGLILFYMGVLLSFSIFFMTGFIKAIPYELEEAARIDGASPIRIFRKIILPLLTPILATIFIILLIFIWTDFFYPFYLLTHSNQNTLTLSLYAYGSGAKFETRWQLVFTDVVLASLPLIVVYFFAQKRIVSGVMGGAIQ